MKYLSVLFLVIATLLSCDKDASEKSEKSDDDKKDTKLTLCDCLESKNKKDGDDLTAWYNSEDGKHCDKLIVDAEDGAEAKCTQIEETVCDCVKAKAEAKDAKAWAIDEANAACVEAMKDKKAIAECAKKHDNKDDYGKGGPTGAGGHSWGHEHKKSNGYDEYGYDEGDSWGYESDGYDEYGYDEGDSWGYGDYESMPDTTSYGYYNDGYDDYGYLDVADDACSCVESLTSLIYNVDSYWDLENLESTIKRELPQCDDIMEDSRVENYLDRNCPYAEEDLMEALEYVSMKFNPVE